MRIVFVFFTNNVRYFFIGGRFALGYCLHHLSRYDLEAWVLAVLCRNLRRGAVLVVRLKSCGQCWFLLGLEMLLFFARELLLLIDQTACVCLHMRNVCCAWRGHKVFFRRHEIAKIKVFWSRGLFAFFFKWVEQHLGRCHGRGGVLRLPNQFWGVLAF